MWQNSALQQLGGAQLQANYQNQYNNAIQAIWNTQTSTASNITADTRYTVTPPATVPAPDTNMAWLDRRVDEMRVKL